MSWMWCNKGRGRPARLGVVVALVVMSGLSAAGLATTAVASGQSASDRPARLASSHYGACNWLGQVILVGFDFAPAGTMRAAGQLLPISTNVKLYYLLGDNFGGQPDQTFGLPDLRGKAPPGLHYVICTSGSFPVNKASGTYGNSCNYQGQVVLVSFDFSFVGTVAARGELLSTSTYSALFARVGYTFGGSSGSQMFGVPDLRARAPGGLHYRICTSGPYPSSQSPSSRQWCNWIGQIVLASFNVSLRGTLPPRGQVIPIQPNAALFSLLGNSFGGNQSMSTFGLPNLRGKAPPGLHYLVCNSGAYPPRT
jgi:microcystin-dependent protein